MRNVFKGGVLSREREVNEDSGDEYDGLEDDAVGFLKTVSVSRNRKRGHRANRKKR